MQNIDTIQVIAILSVLLLIQTARASYWQGRMKDNERLLDTKDEETTHARERAERLEKTLRSNLLRCRRFVS